MSFASFPLISSGLNTLIFSLALLLALAIDRYLGEPAVRWHPVVWIGNYLGWAGRLVQRFTRQALAQNADYKAFWLAALMWIAGVAIFYIAAYTLQSAIFQLPTWLGPLGGGVLAALLLGLALKPMLAWAMLRSEALAVETALNQSLAAGRERLSWLVSRDVTHLTGSQVRESAIETLAENLNDSVVAPIFWFVLLGLPGAALYRFANTADAMWGYRGIYKGKNWEWAGKWAAWVDDILSWIPARITALLLLMMYWFESLASASPQLIAANTVDQDTAVATSLLSRLRAEASHTPSPNSGWPMAAMALALGVSLHKPGVYVLNAKGRVPVQQDTQRAVIYASKALVALVVVAQAAIIFGAIGVFV